MGIAEVRARWVTGVNEEDKKSKSHLLELLKY